MMHYENIESTLHKVAIKKRETLKAEVCAA